VIERLTERRIAVEKAVTTLGEAPSGLRDVFELCRGFERAFTNIVNVRWRFCTGFLAGRRGGRLQAAGGWEKQLPAAASSWGTGVHAGRAVLLKYPNRSTTQPLHHPPSPPTLIAALSHQQESPAANRIKEAFFSEKGLAGNVQKLPLEKVFEIESVKKITKTADGYQPHLVSPEQGLRLMATRALDQVEGPVSTCVSAVYSLLVSSARDAAAAAGEHTEAAMSGKVPLNVPEFRNFIMPAVVRALDEWRTEAETSECRLFGGWGLGVMGRLLVVVWRAWLWFNDAPPAHCIYSSQPNTTTPTSTPPITAVAKMLVDMERSYITAGFFRYTMYRRYSAMQQTNALQQALHKGQPGQKKGLASFLPGGGGGAGNAQPDGPPVPGQPPAVGGGRSTSGGGSGVGMNLSSLADPSDYLASHLDKKVNEDSARGSLPVQGWRWQKRFFIVSDSQRALFYFKCECAVCGGGGGGGGGVLGFGFGFGFGFVFGFGDSCAQLQQQQWADLRCSPSRVPDLLRPFPNHSTPSPPLRPTPTPLPPSNHAAPDDVPKPNGLRARVDLTACVIEDLDENGNPRPMVRWAPVLLVVKPFVGLLPLGCGRDSRAVRCCRHSFDF